MCGNDKYPQDSSCISEDGGRKDGQWDLAVFTMFYSWGTKSEANVTKY